jgi:magnesium chelatase subunit I
MPLKDIRIEHEGMSGDKVLFPFTEIIGQDDMKRALLLNIIDPGIGGVLIKGDKGTAKSTAVRSLALILPPRPAAEGCPFCCDPGFPKRMCSDCRERADAGENIREIMRPMRVVELPLSATEDRITGTLDIEHILSTGKKKFEPGILARANGNLLYVDEVNLLDDRIVDILLDSAAMGVNYVEREGISFSHPSRFILVGTMNPEEGDLRPQLLDRFGLSVTVESENDIRTRMEIIKRRLSFDSNPEDYIERHSGDLSEMRSRIIAAIKRLDSVTVGDDMLRAATIVSVHFGMEGHRSDIAIIRAARANAALEGRTRVTSDDLRSTSGLVLAHRIKKRPFEKTKFDREELERCLAGL